MTNNAMIASPTNMLAGINLAALDQIQPTSPDYVPLTADALLEYCSVRLRDLDRQVQSFFSKQNGRNGLSAAMSKLNDRVSKPTGDVLSDPAEQAAIRKELKAAINAAESGGFAAEAAALNEQLVQFNRTTHFETPEGQWIGDAGIDQEELKDLANAVTNIQSDLNRGGELDMIKLQSLMSTRQQAVSLTTNMLQTLSQATNQIAQNMRG